MKILTVCSHGNIRSVALAYILKTLFNHEVIAVGEKRVVDSTMEILSDWADMIVKFTPGSGAISGRNIKKIIHFDIEEDIWHDAHAQGLTHRLYKELSKHPELWK
jgi:galactitol-specific phosphotransferase system IIB component